MVTRITIPAGAPSAALGPGFIQRLIGLQIQLAPNTGTNKPNTFAGTSSDTVTVSGLRTSVRMQNSGSPANSTAQVKVWGLAPSLMNQLSTLGLVVNLVPKNQLTITAGDKVNGMATVFTGTIWQAYGDYSAQPDVPFVFECLQSGSEAVISAPPSSFPGTQSVAQMMSGFARQMNLGFENNGVTAQLTNQYFSGAIKIQAQKCADTAGIQWGIVQGNVLAIWPRGGNRTTSNPPVISPADRSVSYPSFTQQGIVVKTLFNPVISFGALVKVESSLLSAIAAAQPSSPGLKPGSANQTFPTQWAVYKLDLALNSMLPKGDWLSIVYGYNPGSVVIPPP